MVSTKFKVGDKVRYTFGGTRSEGVVCPPLNFGFMMDDRVVVWAFWGTSSTPSFIDEKYVELLSTGAKHTLVPAWF